MVLLENDTFLTELTRMFQKSKSTATGSVQITMKKYDGRDKPVLSTKNKGKVSKKKESKDKDTKSSSAKHHGHPPDQTSCLMRAKLHNRKISTLVHSKDVNRFQLAYCNLLRGNMDSLKKIKKVKSKAAKATS